MITITNVAIVGIGNIECLLHYRFHRRNKWNCHGSPSTDDHKLVGTKSRWYSDLRHLHIKRNLRDKEIQTAILTVPSVKSQVADLLVEASIKGMWLFSRTLNSSKDGSPICRFNQWTAEPFSTLCVRIHDKQEAQDKSPSLSVFRLSGKTQWLSGLYHADFISSLLNCAEVGWRNQF